jgi:hypothetical protein
MISNDDYFWVTCLWIHSRCMKWRYGCVKFTSSFLIDLTFSLPRSNERLYELFDRWSQFLWHFQRERPGHAFRKFSIDVFPKHFIKSKSQSSISSLNRRTRVIVENEKVCLEWLARTFMRWSPTLKNPTIVVKLTHSNHLMQPFNSTRRWERIIEISTSPINPDIMFNFFNVDLKKWLWIDIIAKKTMNIFNACLNSCDRISLNEFRSSAFQSPIVIWHPINSLHCHAA